MLINNILIEYLDIYAIIYLDNILIYSENLKDYRKHIIDVLERLLTRQLRYNLEKYKFHQKEVEFLRFIVGINGIQIDPGKIKKIFDWSESKNLKR